MSIKGFNMFKRGNQYILRDEKKDELKLNRESIEDYDKIIEKLGVLNREFQNDKNKESQHEKLTQIYQLLFYYKDNQNVGSEILKEFAKSAGIPTYNPKVIQSYIENFRTTTFPLFFKQYPDIVDFTKDNWNTWCEEIVKKCFKSGISDLGGFNPKLFYDDEEKKKLQKKIKEYKIAEGTHKGKTYFNTKYEEDELVLNILKMKSKFFKLNNIKDTALEAMAMKGILPKDKIQKYINNNVDKAGFITKNDADNSYILNGTLIYTIPYDYTTKDFSPINLDKVPKNDDVLKVTVTFKDTGIEVNVELAEAYANLRKFINDALKICMDDYQKETKVKLGEIKPFQDGKRKRKTSKN